MEAGRLHSLALARQARDKGASWRSNKSGRKRFQWERRTWILSHKTARLSGLTVRAGWQTFPGVGLSTFRNIELNVNRVKEHEEEGKH
jgi:hypothetical protein